MATRRPSLEQVVSYRLAEIADLFTSGVSELTGKLKRDGARQFTQDDQGEVTGRFGGVKSAFPELRHLSDSPKSIAAAIRRGSGKVFDRVYGTVSEEFSRDFSPAQKRSPGKPTVRPHKRLRPYCLHCRGFHTKGQHRFHGRGSFHRTHLWSFPKMPALNTGDRMTLKQASDTFRDLMAKARSGHLTDADKKKLTIARQTLRRIRRPVTNTAKRKAVRRPAVRIRRRPATNSRAITDPTRIGNVVELRYDRDIGAHPGFYKHPFGPNIPVKVLPPGKAVKVVGGVLVGGRIVK